MLPPTHSEQIKHGRCRLSLSGYKNKSQESSILIIGKVKYLINLDHR